MSGSAEVNGKLTLWALGTHKALEKEMDTHIKKSQEYAVANHRWDDPTGSATAGLKSKTEATPAMITSTIYGDEKLNEWLDQAWFFKGRYKLIERARSNNLVGLWTRLRAVMRGTGFIRGG